MDERSCVSDLTDENLYFYNKKKLNNKMNQKRINEVYVMANKQQKNKN